MSYSNEDIAEAKAHIAANFSREDQLALKQLAETMRRPMNRKARRIFASRMRKAGR